MITTNIELKPRVIEFLDGGIPLYINGEFVPASSGKTFAVSNPATEEVIAEVSEAEEIDIHRAVQAARRAFEEGEWP